MVDGSFGRVLRDHRAAANLTQEELAERAGLSPHTISMLERGVRRAPRPSTVELLAGALGLDAERRRALVAVAQGRPAEVELEATAAATRTLPRDVASFTGRGQELDRLLATAFEAAGAVGICAIDGMPGVGKTAFAVHAAHELAGRFPDGQLFLDLHGHTAGQRPVTPADALRALLLAAGVGASLVPADLDGRAALWRDRLAGTRTLVLLDDAVGHEQVRPLLPGAAGCLVLVTSRRRLAALEDVVQITLGTLPPARAAELFARLSRPGAGGVEPAAVAELVELCGCLPLAIGLTAGRLRSHSSWTARHLAGTIRAARDRLAEMRAENVAVSAAFELSYRDLPADQGRLFRRLGLHPGRDIDAHAAAALDGADVASVRRRLDALYGDHLLDEPAPGRYRLHDLIREYARGLGAGEDGDAVERLLDYYACATSAASRHLTRRTEPGLPSPACCVETPDLSTRQRAMAWLEAERPNLSACLDHAVAHGREAQAVRLAHAMHAYLRVAGHWEQGLAVHRLALDAAVRAGDRRGQADALGDLGVIQRLRGEHRAAADSLLAAVDVYRELDDRLGQANALYDLGVVRRLTNQYPAACASLGQALALYRAVGDRLGQANALDELGCARYESGDLDAATRCLEDALGLYRDLDDRHGQANALFVLGILRYHVGDYVAASATQAEALAIYREVRDRLGQANAVANLGIAQCVVGDAEAGTTSLSQAFALYRDLVSPMGQANSLTYLGVAQRLTGRHAEATASLTEALRLFRELGARTGEAKALERLGAVQHAMGEYELAGASLAGSLALFRELEDRSGQAAVLNWLGRLLLDQSRPDTALAHHRQALELVGGLRSPLEEARTLEGIGRCLLRAGEPDEGAAHLRRALAIYRRLGVPEAEPVAEALAAL